MLVNTVYVNSVPPAKNTTIVLIFSLEDGTIVYTGTGNNFTDFINGNLPMNLNQNYGLMQSININTIIITFSQTLDESGKRPIYLIAVKFSTGLCSIQMKG